MNLQILKQNSYLMKSVRNNMSFNEDFEGHDEHISQMSKKEIVSRFCNWNNMPGWGDTILIAYETLKDSSYNGLISFEKITEKDNLSILDCLRKRGKFPEKEDLSFKQSEFESYISSMDVRSSLAEFLIWNGLGGYEPLIFNMLITLDAAEE